MKAHALIVSITAIVSASTAALAEAPNPPATTNTSSVATSTRTTAAPTAAARPRLRVAVYSLKSNEALKPLANRMTDEILLELQLQKDLIVVGESELKLMIAHGKAQADVDQCEGSEGCLAKLTRAVEAEKVILGWLARWGDGGTFVTLSLANAETGAIERGDSCHVEKSEDASLASCVRMAANRLLQRRSGDEAKLTLNLEGTKLGVSRSTPTTTPSPASPRA